MGVIFTSMLAEMSDVFSLTVICIISDMIYQSKMLLGNEYLCALHLLTFRFAPLNVVCISDLEKKTDVCPLSPHRMKEKKINNSRFYS